jgi:hypothetical protein
MVFAFRTALALAACLCVSPLAAPADAPLSGRSIAEVLRSIEHPGLQFVFSSQLLPDDLRVTAEPAQRNDELGMVRAILLPHDLTLAVIQPGVYAVVRAPPGPASAAGPPAPVPPLEPLGEVVVSASRYRIGGDAIASSTLLDAQALRAQPGLGDDAMRALQHLPGLAHDGFSARSNVRGGEASETLLLLDGFPLRQAFHLPAYQAFFSAIDSQLIGSAEVYTGGFPARYGNRMSGVFDLRTIGALDAPRRSLALDFFNASARVSGGRAAGESGNGYEWLASGRVGTLKPMLELFAQDVGQPGYSDAYARAGWGNPLGLLVTANLLVSRDELTISREERGERGDLESRARYLWLRADQRWNESLRGSLIVGQTRLENFREGTADEPQISVGFVEDRRSSRVTDVRGSVAWHFRPRQLVEAGFELIDEDARYDYRAAAVFSPDVALLFDRAPQLQREIEVSPDRTRGSVFASWRWRISDGLTTEAGGRAQRLLTSDLEGDWISEPRLGVRWEPRHGTRLQLTWGRFHQVDEIDELDVEDGVTQFSPPQRSEHLIAGLEQQLGERTGLRLEAFHKRQTTPRDRFENLLDTQTVFPEIAPDRIVVSPDRAELVGVELTGNYDTPMLHAWGTVGWSRSEDLIDAAWVPRSWDQRWTVSAGAQWTTGPWLFSGQVDVHQGWPATRLLADAQGNPVLGPRNGDRLTTFAQLDLRVQYTRQLPLGELTLVAQVVNATNRGNECCTELVVQDGELAGESLQWLPIVPSLGVRWSF